MNHDPEKDKSAAPLVDDGLIESIRDMMPVRHKDLYEFMNTVSVPVFNALEQRIIELELKLKDND